MNYTKAVEYILDIPKFTKKNALQNTEELLEKLGNPQEGMKIIHVAGTNGKGSVCAYLSNILVLSGKRTGMFTSPHLVKINERFRINQEMISDEEFTEAFHLVLEAGRQMMKEGYLHPTFFEFLFAMGMVVFRKRNMEYVVLETGLGGRLDATNIIKQPVAVVITSISLDHTEYLGDTIGLIAGEKAGIIKQGIPVIYDARGKEAARVIEERAALMNAPLYPLYEHMYKISVNRDKNVAFSMRSRYDEYAGVTVPSIAEYQVINAALAVLAAETVNVDGTVSKEIIIQGIESTRWQGRMESVLPGVIVDGAHNTAGIAEFVKTAARLNDMRIIMLFSAVREKDYEQMIETICSSVRFDTVIVTRIDGDRSVEAEELQEIFSRYTDRKVLAVPDIEQAFMQGMELRREGIFFCAGSLYLVGEIEDIVRRNYHD